MTQQSFERLCFATSSRVNDFLFESSFFVSFDFFFAKEGNDLLEFCFLSVVVVVVVVVIAARSGVRSRLFFVRRSRPRSSSDDDDDGNIPLQGERENFCGLERTKERDLSSVSEYERSTQRASNMSTTYALKP